VVSGSRPPGARAPAPPAKPRLPIDELLAGIVETLRTSARLVLRAPPGAGKTTRVPAALLDAGIGGGRQVVVLEPRRIAARASAEYVAAERGTEVGGEIGYRVRFESRGDRATRLWFVTEGVFSRTLVGDPYLDDVGVVVLDEFHERHLQGDVALAVVRELQDTVRPDLKLLVMSATLDTEKIAAFLAAPVLTSEGRSYPIEIEHDREPSRARLSARATAAVARTLAVDRSGGDVLVFLPGAAAIRETEEALAAVAGANDADVVPLHGDLPLERQRRAIVRGPRRKIVLSTNVAETALTIEGVTTVVDSGLVREARFDPRHGINRLEEVRISRAAAEQRAGRAGRSGPGRCIRLWSAAEHAERLEREAPEVLRLDLSTTLLELRAWGVRDLAAFGWLDPPSRAAIDRAERLLVALGAIDESSGRPTVVGGRMLAIAVAPRLARLLLEAERLQAGDGALVAALASERDILRERRALGERDGARFATGRSDLTLRADLFREVERRALGADACRVLGLDPGAVRAVERARRRLAGELRSGASRDPGSEEPILRAVLAGYPDRVARRREVGSPRALLVGGTGVVLDPTSVVRDEELFVAVDLDAGPRREHAEARVRLASGIDRSWLAEMFPASMRSERVLVFDADRQRVVARERDLYGDLVLAERIRVDVDPKLASPILLAQARLDPTKALRIGREGEALLTRVEFLARAMPELELPTASELLDRALERVAAGKRSFAELRDANVAAAIRAALDGKRRSALEREAPERFRLPAGHEARLRYERDRPPTLSARIQQLFGLATTPAIAGGRARVVVEILAPNDRPVQVTEDLRSFWYRTYPEVRKQLRSRYPKHAWPESPSERADGKY
jgi:ATP-dependent helicase HrpB